MIKYIGEEPIVKDVDLKNIQEVHDIVGGAITTSLLTNDILMLVNDEAIFQSLPTNFTINGISFPGNVCFCSFDSPDFIGLNQEQIDYVLNLFKENSNSIQI